jgi:hypothetical protein
MLETGLLLESETTTTPFAAGILAFAVHMSGDSKRAEEIARAAIENGFDDPWTLHAVAHALYSLGRPQECAAWLRQHRTHVEKCSSFMRGHFEFHSGLCLVDMEDSNGISTLIRGPLWGTMSKEMQADYWNAAGLLNLLWKAELRGLDISAHEQIAEALKLLEDGGADPAKSPVFSLCILRWSTGVFREQFRKALVSSDNNQTLVAVARAVCTMYHDPESTKKGQSAERSTWKDAARALSPFSEKLETLGASPEQREVIEEFVGVVGKQDQGNRDRSCSDDDDDDYDECKIDLASWDARNRRPNVKFYDSIFPRIQGQDT